MVFKGSKITADIVGRVGVTAAPNRFNDKVQELRIAVQHRYQKDGEWVDGSTTWITYTAAGDYADALKEYQKNDLVEITGAAVETRTYERQDKSEGIAITARYGTIALLDRKEQDAGF